MTASSNTIPQRQIRPHKKSRGGCGNCKIRSVKCDETKPSCKRCRVYGVICSYNKREDADLRFAVEVAATVAPRDLCYWPNKDEHTLSQFQLMTALTISTGQRLYIYQNDLIPLARHNPCLMHAILSITLMHTRLLRDNPNPKLASDEAYHLAKSTSLFRKQLTQPIRSEQQGALWTTAAFLFTLVFGYVEEESPEECWPLRPPSPADLNWLTMNEGKNQIRFLGKDLAPDPIFGDLDQNPLNGFKLKGVSWEDAECFSSEFLDMFGLDEHSTEDNNPFHLAALGLSRILKDSGKPIISILSFLSFISNISPHYKLLLELKEPRALLLLAWWYAKVSTLPVWWMKKRTQFEGLAICMFLERFHTDDPHIQNLLQFPKLILTSSSDSDTITTLVRWHVKHLHEDKVYENMLHKLIPPQYYVPVRLQEGTA